MDNKNYIKLQFGLKLRKIRLRHKCTQKDLAKAINITPVTISQIETGTKFVSASTLFSICEFFNITVRELFDFETSLDENEIYCDIVNTLKKNPKRLKELQRIINAVLNEK